MTLMEWTRPLVTIEDAAEAMRVAFPPPIRRERPAGRPPLLPHQVPPQGDWRTWILLGGRGAGKSEAGSDYFDTYMTEHPGHRGRIIGPTLGDVFESCINGPSGLKAINPEIKILPSAAGGSKAVWPNNSEALLLGTYSPNDIERLRAAGNRHLDWWEEAGANRNFAKAWDQAKLGLRLGDRPHSIITTTPRNVKKLRDLLKRAKTAITRGTIHDNPYLDEEWKAEVVEEYQGTRLGRQELDGELLDDVEGALWTWQMIEDAYATMPVPMVDCVRVVVAVDPAAKSKRDSDDTGIVICGKGSDGRGYVLGERSCHLSPSGWARRSIQAFDDYEADQVIGETNNGGEMVEATLRTVRKLIPYKPVTATRGKAIRAQPIASLYEQKMISHCVQMPALDEQLTGWEPDSGESPDKLDALVWGFTALGFGGKANRWSLV